MNTPNGSAGMDYHHTDRRVIRSDWRALMRLIGRPQRMRSPDRLLKVRIFPRSMRDEVRAEYDHEKNEL